MVALTWGIAEHYPGSIKWHRDVHTPAEHPEQGIMLAWTPNGVIPQWVGHLEATTEGTGR